MTPETALTASTPTEKTSHLFTPQIHGIEYLQILNDDDHNEMSTTLPTIPWQQQSNHSQTADNAANPRPLRQSVTEQFMSPEVDYDYAAALETPSVAESASLSMTMNAVPSFPEIFKRFNSKMR